MAKIRPHLWYDTHAVEAARLYTSVFGDSRVTDVSIIRDTPSGDCDIVSFELFGQRFQAISAGPLFPFNPSISFLVACDDADEVDSYWRALSDGGTALMPLDTYPFSKRYGWIQDRYGLSWQLMLTDEPVADRITPMLLFTGDGAGRADDAIDLYTSTFPNATTLEVQRWAAGEEPEREGTVKFARFTLDGHGFAAMDSAAGHTFTFNEAVSFMVDCADQREIDRYWAALSAVPEAEQCGWLKDRFGVSWQIVPAAMDAMLRSGTEEQVARVTKAFLAMKKFDVAELERAYSGV